MEFSCKKAIIAIREVAPTTKIIIGGIRWNSIDSIRLLDNPFDENIIYNFNFYEPILFTHQKAYWVKEISKDKITEYPGDMDKFKSDSIRLGAAMNVLIFDNSFKEMGIDFIEKQFLKAVSIAEDRGVSLYCGEYGVIDYAPLESTLNWFSDMNAMFKKYGIGRAEWTYKK